MPLYQYYISCWLSKKVICNIADKLVESPEIDAKNHHDIASENKHKRGGKKDEEKSDNISIQYIFKHLRRAFSDH